MSLSVKLPLLIGIAVAITSISAGALILREARGTVIDESLRTATARAQTYAAAVSAHLSDTALSLEATAAGPGVAGYAADAAPAEAAAQVLLTKSDVLEYVMVIGPDGTIGMVAPRDLDGPLTTPSVSHEAWYREVLDRGDTVVSNLHISAATHRPSVVIATPLRDPSGAVTGAWVGGLRLQAFSRFAPVVARGASPEEGAIGMLTDRRGLIIAHQGNPAFVVNQTDFSAVPAVRSALAGQTDAGQWFNPVERSSKLGAYLPLPGPGWAVVVATPRDVALAPLDRLITASVVLSLGVAVVLCGIGAVLGRRLARPLRRLTTATALVAAGQPHVRAAVDDGEVGELAARFNEMLDALAQNEGALKQRADALAAANAELDAFAYSVSHDLRAPLRAIDGFGQLLIEDQGDSLPPEALEHLGRMRAAAQRMSHLIDDLLALSRIAKVDLRRNTVDLSALAETIVAELQVGDPERDVSVDIAAGLTTGADPIMAEVALRNLLGNAWKFTEHTEDPHITVSASTVPDWFVVADDGAGFDMALAGHLFEPFRRLHSTASFAGTGIGLATVRRVLLRHGGQIRADAAPGRGAWFTFTFSSGAEGPAATLPHELPRPVSEPARTTG